VLQRTERRILSGAKKGRRHSYVARKKECHSQKGERNTGGLSDQGGAHQKGDGAEYTKQEGSLNPGKKKDLRGGGFSEGGGGIVGKVRK